jgi:hypothetical protein
MKNISIVARTSEISTLYQSLQKGKDSTSTSPFYVTYYTNFVTIRFILFYSNRKKTGTYKKTLFASTVIQYSILVLVVERSHNTKTRGNTHEMGLFFTLIMVMILPVFMILHKHKVKIIFSYMLSMTATYSHLNYISHGNSSSLT